MFDLRILRKRVIVDAMDGGRVTYGNKDVLQMRRITDVDRDTTGNIAAKWSDWEDVPIVENKNER